MKVKVYRLTGAKINILMTIQENNEQGIFEVWRMTTQAYQWYFRNHLRTMPAGLVLLSECGRYGGLCASLTEDGQEIVKHFREREKYERIRSRKVYFVTIQQEGGE